MHRLEPFHPAIRSTILYHANENISFSDLGKKLGVSKQAAQKQVKQGKEIILQSASNEKLKAAIAENKALKEENAKLKELSLNLKRQLLLRSARIFILNCFKERIKKFWPKFDVKRFEPYEKKISS